MKAANMWYIVITQNYNTGITQDTFSVAPSYPHDIPYLGYFKNSMLCGFQNTLPASYRPLISRS